MTIAACCVRAFSGTLLAVRTGSPMATSSRRATHRGRNTCRRPSTAIRSHRGGGNGDNPQDYARNMYCEPTGGVAGEPDASTSGPPARLGRVTSRCRPQVACCCGARRHSPCSSLPRSAIVVRGGTSAHKRKHSKVCRGSTAGQDETSVHRHKCSKAGLATRMVRPVLAPAGRCERLPFGRRRPCCRRPAHPRRRRRLRLRPRRRFCLCSTLLSPSLSPPINLNECARGPVPRYRVFKPAASM